MKNLSASFLLVLLVLAGQLASAQTIRRVNNTGVTGTNIYSTVQAAHDAATGGDIIYLEPSSVSFGNLTCVKQLTIIGNGYFLGQNPGLQLDIRPSIVDAISFAAGSAGSRITGCTINSTFSVQANNVLVERNYIASSSYLGGNPNNGAQATITSAIFRQNYLSGYFYFCYSPSISNVIMSNNIITAGIAISGISYSALNGILITNNVVGGLAGSSGYTIDIDNAVIKNNILTYTGSNNFTPRNNAYSYNISGSTQFGTANGNQSSVAPAAMFVGGTASTDGAFMLKTGANPAVGTGESGVDVGAFGGANPYRQAGIPNVPTIYQYNQAVSGNTLNATISTRSNN